MFKRRNQRTWLQTIAEFFYPKSGWKRAFGYVKHRIKRLPDTPHKIALGIACGAFVTFTPFFGLHFFLAAGLAFVLRGNVLAALLGTFVGNPITFPFIAATSYRLGLWMLGEGHEGRVWHRVKHGVVETWSTILDNAKALFGYPPSPWHGVTSFFYDVFWPYLVGGIVPGLICALVLYFVSKPMISAYQHRRKGALLKKFHELRAKRQQKAD
ncbi:DUF2062 domain-containing protein [Neptunicoccus sediminis]|uniref:DUF2062 domain-containing protein n=1 Tax=Neptunicoccus sediminis TaxID=1892596 RepID=UPI000845E8D7|nr:DUF2062 domain-containing protein [Neptunicoccus sediminis]